MFSVSLPKFAVLTVQLPTGVTACMCHVGEGRFIMDVPPVAFVGVRGADGQGPEVPAEGLPVGWDSTSVVAPIEPVQIVCDAKSGMSVLRLAAERGDAAAVAALGELEAIERMVALRETLTPAQG